MVFVIDSLDDLEHDFVATHGANSTASAPDVLKHTSGCLDAKYAAMHNPPTEGTSTPLATSQKRLRSLTA
jgi:hypothetical protein